MSKTSKLDMLKQELNDLIVTEDEKLCEGEILFLSQIVDELIVEYYQAQIT